MTKIGYRYVKRPLTEKQQEARPKGYICHFHDCWSYT
jgi:hypothetical protein